jgi:hypothetical protein
MALSSSIKWHGSGTLLCGVLQGGIALQLTNETTIFMQKAIYFVSKLIAARGMLELTDRCLYFQVFPFDASFGIRSVSIDVCTIVDVCIERGDLHPRIVVTADKRYEFALSKGQELYDRLKEIRKDPLGQKRESDFASEIVCSCGKSTNSLHAYCPWCGAKLFQI